MELNKFDNKLVRIECIDGNTYEGYCQYNSNDYNYHEFGRDEDGVQIEIYLFFKRDIKKIEEIDKFSSKYGTLEEEIFNEIDFVEDIFESECNEHIIRLLLCIKDKYNELNNKEETKELLETLIKYNKDKEIIKLAKDILNN